MQRVLHGTGEDDHQVQHVPGVVQVAAPLATVNAHRDHLDAHLEGEKRENKVVG